MEEVMDHKKSDLEKRINILRSKMILIGTKEGLSSEKTLRISQKLDTFLTIYQKYMLNNDYC
jgi:hypothetical protein